MEEASNRQDLYIFFKLNVLQLKWTNGQINSTHHGPARYLIQRIDRQTDELHSISKQGCGSDH